MDWPGSRWVCTDHLVHPVMHLGNRGRERKKEGGRESEREGGGKGKVASGRDTDGL